MLVGFTLSLISKVGETIGVADGEPFWNTKKNGLP